MSDPISHTGGLVVGAGGVFATRHHHNAHDYNFHIGPLLGRYKGSHGERP